MIKRLFNERVSLRGCFLPEAIYRIKGCFALLATTLNKKVSVTFIPMTLALCFMLAFFSASSAHAQNINVSAQVDSNVVALGSPFQLTVIISGAKKVEPVQLGTIEGFDADYMGPSQRISIVNGQYSSSVSLLYSLLPTKVGKFEIPALDVKVENQTLKTSPIPIEVVDQTAGLPNQGNQPPAVDLSDKIFLELQVPKTDLIISQKVPVKILLFVTGVNISDVQYPQLDTTGFKLSDYGRPSQYQQVINGIQYNIVEFDAALYPTRAGEIPLGPAALECNLIVPSSRQNRFGSAFDDDFFNAFFDHQERRSITVKSKELKLSVKELPQEGKPANFSGGVGNLNFEASVSPVDIKVGDPITLKMSVQGDGNLSAIHFPALKDDENFKVYEPAIKEEDGSKKLEQVIIARNKELKEVPAFEFVYFNVDLNKYVKISKGPFAINIAESADEKSAPAMAGLDKHEVSPSVIQDALGEDIIFIKESIGEITTRGEYFYHQFWFTAGLGFVIAGWAGFMVYVQMTRRLKTDQDFHRRTHAPKYARAGLESARQRLEEQRPKEFYDTVFKTLQNYVSHRFLIPAGEVSLDQVRSLITGEKSAEILQPMQMIFSECEAVRYASSSMTKDQMALTLERLKTVIDCCEKKGDKKGDRHFFNKMDKKVPVTFFVLLAAANGFAQMSEPLVTIKFNQANNDYRAGKYPDAISNYEEILKGHRESPAVYFNLGNSYFKNKQLGAAILNYERALKLSPRDSDIQFNERYALHQVKQVETAQQKSWMDRWFKGTIGFYSIGEMILILLILAAAGAVWLILILYLPNLKSAALMGWAGIGLLLSIYSAGLFFKWDLQKNAAVVLKDTQAKFEPRQEATTHFELFEGNGVKVVGEEGEWMKVKRFDGKLGWIEKQAVGKI